MATNTNLVVYGFIALATAGISGTQTKPVVTSDIIVDYWAPPSTLQQAVSGAAAIVVGTVRTERTFRPASSASSPRLVYSVSVIEILRPHPMLTQTELEVYRMGGDIDAGDHVIRKNEVGFPRFSSGHQYLMFLSWNRSLNAFEPKYGPNGIFELFPDGRVQTPGKAPFARAQATKSSGMLVQEIKQILAQQ